MSLFLTKDELIELTSYKYNKKQVDWLIDHNYKFDVGADGSPKVLRNYVETLLGYTIKSTNHNYIPDFRWLHNAKKTVK